jgi:hypothetical protein
VAVDPLELAFAFGEALFGDRDDEIAVGETVDEVEVGGD